MCEIIHLQEDELEYISNAYNLSLKVNSLKECSYYLYETPTEDER